MTPTLKSELLVKTAERIGGRIDARFPDAGLGEVAGAVARAARDASERAAIIAKPNRWMRAGQVLLVVVAVAGVAAYFAAGTGGVPFWRASLDFLDAAKGNAALLTATGVFLWNLETWTKR
jgi:hypothetical protein